MGNDNHEPTLDRPNGVQRVCVSFNPNTHHADIDLGGLNLDDALSLLERAHRELDARYRFQRARELLAEQMQNQAVAELLKKNPRGPLVQG